MKALDLRDAADELKASADSQSALIQKLMESGQLDEHQAGFLTEATETYRAVASQLIIQTVEV
jgi:CTP-dependent riboflavin kinase